MNIIPAIYHDRIWNIGDSKISCSSELATQLQFRNGQGLNLGIRPEYLTIVPNSTPDTLSLTVQTLETLGRETLLKARINGTSTDLNLLASPSTSGQFNDLPDQMLGKQLTIQLASEWLFIFDPSTGRRLFPPNT